MKKGKYEKLVADVEQEYTKDIGNNQVPLNGADYIGQ